MSVDHWLENVPPLAPRRGPRQDESRFAHPLDARGAAHVEGRIAAYCGVCGSAFVPGEPAACLPDWCGDDPRAWPSAWPDAQGNGGGGRPPVEIRRFDGEPPRPPRARRFLAALLEACIAVLLAGATLWIGLTVVTKLLGAH